MAEPQPKDGFSKSMGTLQSLLSKTDKAPGSVDSGGEGTPIRLEIAKVMEDPEQPRTEFDDDFLAWLATDIKRKGMKSPISVRPEKNGKHITNHGACRLRASKLAGMTTIPAIIDAEYDPYDQVSENIKRKSLSARDLARWIKKRILEGDSRKDVKQRLDVDDTYISRHLSILDVPDEIMTMVYDTGVCTEVRALNELSLCNKQDAAATLHFCNCKGVGEKITVKEIQGFKKSLNKVVSPPPIKTDASTSGDTSSQIKSGACASGKTKSSSSSVCQKINKPVIRVEHDRKTATLLIHKRPTTDQMVWIQYDGGSAAQVMAAKVNLKSIKETGV